jgi:integrase
VEDNHGATQADHVLDHIRGIFGWFETRNEFYRSPIAKGMKRNGRTARDRIFTDDEIRALWAAAGDCASFGAFCRIALLTAQRKAKVASMRWDDIDEEGVWTIRSEAREKGNAGALKLPALALEVIEAQPRLAGNPYIFAGRGGRPLGDVSKGKRRLEKKLPPDMPQWGIHDLRRTARSLLSRAGTLPHISEQVLGHSLRGIEKTYDRHSYSAEKAFALAQLAALIERILNPPANNVVVMPQKA